MVWCPHVTVAAVLEQHGKYLFVHENSDDGPVINQPAGHLEEHETLIEAISREVMEETGREFAPTHLVGIYQYQAPRLNTTYLRFAFCGSLSQQTTNKLDPDIIETLWLDREALAKHPAALRSPLVLQTLNDYEAGRAYPLELVHTIS